MGPGGPLPAVQHAPAHSTTREAPADAPPGPNGSHPGLGFAPDREPAEPRRSDLHRAVVTSPAVGIYQPRRDLSPGSRVREGDRLGFVDVLGVPQDVVAPADGVVGASLAEPGQPVEYGQELLAIELITPSGGIRPSALAGDG
ncbi:MAG TPA: hypothetical protein VNJ28_04185 [Candidatus Limnocylindrales bacterium]|nr:hypothetical protein [Candidatus Limnocylindrales bacterium]